MSETLAVPETETAQRELTLPPFDIASELRYAWADPARMCLAFFRKLWKNQGFDLAILKYDRPPRPAEPFEKALYFKRNAAFLASSYRGLSEGEIETRKRQLERYQQLKGQHDNLSDGESRQSLSKKMKLITDDPLSLARDLNGIAGLETHRILTIGDKPLREELLTVSCTYPLDEERITYDLPKRKGDLKRYPYRGAFESITVRFKGYPIEPIGELKEPEIYEEYLGKVITAAIETLS